MLCVQFANTFPSSGTGLARRERLGRPGSGASGGKHSPPAIGSRKEGLRRADYQHQSADGNSRNVAARIRWGMRTRRSSIPWIPNGSERASFFPQVTRRRRSSLAQLTDILREWGGSTTRSSLRGNKQAQLCRRETLADLAKSLPWGKCSTADMSSVRKRRESSADSGIKSMSTKRRDTSTTAISELRSDLARLWGSRRESTIGGTIITPRTESFRRGSGESGKSVKSRRDSATVSRRGSGESARSRRDSATSSAVTPPPKFQRQHTCHHHRRRASRAGTEAKYYREEQRPSTSSTASDSAPAAADAGLQTIPPPIITTSSVTPPSVSPTAPGTIAIPAATSPIDRQSPTGGFSPVGRTSPTPLVSTRQDSTTQVYHKNRRDSRSPDRRSGKEARRFSRLTRQGTAIDESLPPPTTRRESQPTLSPDLVPDDGKGRQARRDSLSPDSASCGRSRRDSRARLSPERGDREVSPVGRSRRGEFPFPGGFPDGS